MFWLIILLLIGSVFGVSVLVGNYVNSRRRPRAAHDEPPRRSRRKAR